MMGGMAGAQASTDNASMQLIRMNPLAFRKEPVELYSVTHTPNGSFVVIYFTEGEKSELQEMWMELFDSVGTSLLSAKLGEFDPNGEKIPHGQIILKKDRFICEYYPDITSMEVCTQTVYRYTGKRIQKPTIKIVEFFSLPQDDFRSVEGLENAGNPHKLYVLRVLGVSFIACISGAFR